MKNEVREFKRERVLEEATRLFYERGFQGASIDAIAESLKVTKPFVYTYFDNKHALLEAIYDRAVQALMAGVEEIFAVERTPEDQLRRLVEFYVRENIESREITSIFLNEEKNLPAEALDRVRRQHHDFDSRLTGLIVAGIRTGVFQATDATLASLAISGMVRWVHRWYDPDGRMTATQVCEEMATLALNLVCFSPTAKRSRSRISRSK